MLGPFILVQCVMPELMFIEWVANDVVSPGNADFRVSGKRDVSQSGDADSVSRQWLGCYGCSGRCYVRPRIGIFTGRQIIWRSRERGDGGRGPVADHDGAMPHPRK